jgi:hypothetical protein
MSGSFSNHPHRRNPFAGILSHLPDGLHFLPRRSSKPKEPGVERFEHVNHRVLHTDQASLEGMKMMSHLQETFASAVDVGYGRGNPNINHD